MLDWSWNLTGKEPGETFPANAASSHLRKPQVTTQAETFSGEAASLSEDDDSDDEQLEGLQGFENVLVCPVPVFLLILAWLQHSGFLHISLSAG